MIALSDLYKPLWSQLTNHPNLQLDAKDNNGNTPLLCALERYNTWPVPHVITTIEQLLEKGADPEISNNDGLTPLKQAEKMNSPQLIELFKDAIVKKHSTQHS
jgi:ankyrin repeat protein